MCDFSPEKNVHEFVPTTPRMLLNSFTFSFMSGNQKNHLEMIRLNQLPNVKSQKNLKAATLPNHNQTPLGKYVSITGVVKFKRRNILTYVLLGN